jgi:hypothetical protein
LKSLSPMRLNIHLATWVKYLRQTWSHSCLALESYGGPFSPGSSSSSLAWLYCPCWSALTMSLFRCPPTLSITRCLKSMPTSETRGHAGFSACILPVKQPQHLESN